MKKVEKISLLVLGGIGGFVGSLIILLLGMGERIDEPFLAYWFVGQSSFFAFVIIGSFVCIGSLVAYIYSVLVKEEDTVRAQEINKSTNEFVSLITHQMRAPLSFISYSKPCHMRNLSLLLNY